MAGPFDERVARARRRFSKESDVDVQAIVNKYKVTVPSGTQRRLDLSSLQNAVNQADDANALEDALGMATEKGASALGFIGSVLGTAGELLRGTGYGIVNSVLAPVADAVMGNDNTNSFKTDISGDGVIDDRDTLIGQWKDALNPNERVQGYGSFEPLKVDEENDGLVARALKLGAAGTLDIGLDPTTYVGFGTGALGAKTAGELGARAIADLAVDGGTKAVASKAAREALEGAGDDVIRGIARRESERLLATQADTGVTGLGKAVDDQLASMTTEELMDAAAREIATGASAAYRSGRSSGLRGYLSQELGDEAGNRLFNALPRPVKGGPQSIFNSVSSDFSQSPVLRALGLEAPEYGGGQVLGRLGLGEAIAGAEAGRAKASNMVFGKALGSITGNMGRSGPLMQRVRQAAAAGSLDEQLTAERALEAARQAQILARREVAPLRAAGIETVKYVEDLAQQHGEAPFSAAVRQAWDNDPEDLARMAADETLDPLSRDAARAAKQLQDVPVQNYVGRLDDLGDAFSSSGVVEGPRLVLSAEGEEAMKRVAKSSKSGSGSSFGRREATLLRDENGEAVRYLTPSEANEMFKDLVPVKVDAAGRVVSGMFEMDPVKVFNKAMGKIEENAVRARLATTLRDAGVVFDLPEDSILGPKRLTKTVRAEADRLAGQAEKLRARADEVDPSVQVTDAGRIETPVSSVREIDDEAAASVAERDTAAQALAAARADNKETKALLRTEAEAEHAAAKATLRTEEGRAAKILEPVAAERAQIEDALARHQAAADALAAAGDDPAAKSAARAQGLLSKKSVKEMEGRLEQLGQTEAAIGLQRQANADAVSAAKARLDNLADEAAATETGQRVSALKDDVAGAKARLKDLGAARKQAVKDEAAQAEAAVLRGKAATLEEQVSSLRELLGRTASEPLGRQSGLYQDMVDAVIKMRKADVAGWEARIAEADSKLAASATEIARLRDGLTRSQSRLGRFEKMTTAGASVKDRILRDPNFERLGTVRVRGNERDVIAAVRDTFTDASIATAMTRMYQAGSKGGGRTIASMGLIPLEQLWRTYATVGRGPSFVTRNILGGTWNAFLGGTGTEDFAAGARYTSTLWSALRDAEKELAANGVPEEQLGTFVDDFIAQRLTEADASGQMLLVHRQLEANGAFSGQTSVAMSSELAGKTPNEVVNGPKRNPFENLPTDDAGAGTRAWMKAVDVGLNNRWVGAMSRFSEMSEVYLRSSQYYAGIRRFGSDSGGLAAADLLVKATQFDYSDLSPIEQKVVRHIAPFFVWTRNNVPLQLRTVLNQPGKVNALLTLNENAKEYFGATDEKGQLADRFMPEWLREANAWASVFSVGGNPIEFGIGAPVADLNKYLTVPEFSAKGILTYPIKLSTGAGDDAVAQLNPGIKAAIEAVTQTNLYTGAKYGGDQSASPLMANIPGLGGYKDPDTGEWKADAFWQSQIRNALPFVGQAERLAPIGPLASKKYQERWLTSVGSAGLGLSGLPVAPLATATDSSIEAEARRESDESMKRVKRELARRGISWTRVQEFKKKYDASTAQIAQLIEQGYFDPPR